MLRRAYAGVIEQLTLEFQIIGRPSLLKRHYIRHCLAATGEDDTYELLPKCTMKCPEILPSLARNPDSCPLQIGDTLISGVFASNNSPTMYAISTIPSDSTLKYLAPVQWGRYIASYELVRFGSLCDTRDQRVREGTVIMIVIKCSIHPFISVI